jgi:hypothetical protein
VKWLFFIGISAPPRGSIMPDSSLCRWIEKSGRRQVEIMQIAMMIVVTTVVLAVVQPFLEAFEGVAVLIIAILAMVLVTWRGVNRTLAEMREGDMLSLVGPNEAMPVRSKHLRSRLRPMRLQAPGSEAFKADSSRRSDRRW